MKRTGFIAGIIRNYGKGFILSGFVGAAFAIALWIVYVYSM